LGTSHYSVAQARLAEFLKEHWQRVGNRGNGDAGGISAKMPFGEAAETRLRNLDGDVNLKAAALALSERAIAMNPIEKDAIVGPIPIEIVARVAARMSLTAPSPLYRHYFRYRTLVRWARGCHLLPRCCGLIQCHFTSHLTLLALAAAASAQNVVVQWNAIPSTTIVTNHSEASVASGAWFAYVHLAVYDAVNAIDHRFQPCLPLIPQLRPTRMLLLLPLLIEF